MTRIDTGSIAARAGGIRIVPSQGIVKGSGSGCGRAVIDHVTDKFISVTRPPKKAYRNACRHATNSNLGELTRQLNCLYKGHNFRKFWNLVRRTKRGNSSDDDISMQVIERHFRAKFEDTDDPDTLSDIRTLAMREVDDKYTSIMSTIARDKAIFPSMIKRYIKSLNTGCSPGLDGIMTEHLKYSIDSRIPAILSSVLTLCVQYHVVPTSFTRGMLVPLLKKSTLDPSVPSNYRPVTVSSTLSKLLELYILDISGQFEFSDLQFGFVPGRSTNMAAVLAQDVISYCKSRGSPVYACSLDAQGAFDAVPHEILFRKALGVIPDHSWAMMVSWYRSITVQVKWGNQLSSHIVISKGTRHGGLSSPFLFNLFYKDLIDMLSAFSGGITIGAMSYNVSCYADDILICSLTVTGLQKND